VRLPLTLADPPKRREFQGSAKCAAIVMLGKNRVKEMRHKVVCRGRSLRSDSLAKRRSTDAVWTTGAGNGNLQKSQDREGRLVLRARRSQLRLYFFFAWSSHRIPQIVLASRMRPWSAISRASVSGKKRIAIFSSASGLASPACSPRAR